MDPRLEKVLKLPLYQRVLILVSLMLVIAGLFVYFMYLPLREEMANLKQKDASLQSKIQEDQLIADNLPQFKAEFEKMEALLNDALTELPNEKEIPNLLTSITALAKENGLNVTLFKPGAEKPMGFYRVTFKRSEEHTSELQSQSTISYAVFCLKKNLKITFPAVKVHWKKEFSAQPITLDRKSVV